MPIVTKSMTVREVLHEAIDGYRIAVEFSDYSRAGQLYTFIQTYFPKRHSGLTFIKSVRKFA